MNLASNYRYSQSYNASMLNLKNVSIVVYYTVLNKEKNTNNSIAGI